MYSDIFILVCLVFFEVLVFYKLKLQIDKSGILTLILHLIVSILRVSRVIVSVLTLVSSILVWISVHYFIYEMWYIKITFSSENFEIRLRLNKKVTMIKIIEISIMIFLMITFTMNYLIA